MEGECLALQDLSVAAEDGGGDGGQSDHKENFFAERVRSTPMKSPESTVPALVANRRAVDLTQITPIKHGALAEPWTPTANLKMLISAASPDIRDREMKKVLFRPIENDKGQTARPEEGGAEGGAEGDDLAQFDAAADDDADKKPSRKQKSLGLLCQKFLALYPDHTPLHNPVRISLDEVAKHLGVERRRIYDIFNVLEALMIVGRIAKNSYTWYGRQRLGATLRELHRRGLRREAAGGGRDDDGAEGDPGNAGSNRKDKSLRIMSQKFVMLFLVSKTQTVTLDAAAKVLIEEGRDSSHSKYKTKVRRLYDIANVLTSLDLIKKVHVRDERGRKPAFKWLGPVAFGSAGDALNVAAVADPRSSQASQALGTKRKRHASFEVTPTPAAVRRDVSSAPSSPRRELRGPTSQPVDYSRRTASGAAACSLQLGNATENLPSMPLQPPFLPGNGHAPHLAPPSHCLAYLPSLSQPSVVMLYPQASPGLESPEGRKRSREEEEGVRKKASSRMEECHKLRAEPQIGAACPQAASPQAAAPSHYLYVPNRAGLNNMNLLLSAGRPAAGIALPPNSVPTLALPCVLLAPPSLYHYPLLGGGSDAHANQSFGLPAMMSPGHFVMGAPPYSLTADMSPGSSPASPEQGRAYEAGAVGTPRQPNTPEPLAPHTPKETGTSSSPTAFFQTPGTLGEVVSAAAPAARRRASAQRRLDVGHPPNQSDVTLN